MYQNQYEYEYGYEDSDQEFCEECGECGRDDCACGCDCKRSCSKPECECKCYVGPTGPEGLMGPKGSQGPRGIQGQQGREGLPGVRGPQGATGAQGVPGIQGATGSPGPHGLQGPRGHVGATGVMGPQGPQGPQGRTGPAGQDAPILQFASVSLQSFTSKSLCPQDNLTFDVSNIQCGFTISDDYRTVRAMHQGTYVVEFGCLVSSRPCAGDAIALELNNSMVIEESRMAVLCADTYVTGRIIITLQADETLGLVSDCAEAIDICGINNTINAYLIVYQIN